MNSTLTAFARELSAEPVREALRAITGLATRTVSIRAYRYDRGDYLLPHTDFRPGEERRLAFAYYLDIDGDEPLQGAARSSSTTATFENEQLTRTTLHTSIEPRVDRLALFAVNEVALHRVEEVTQGQRLSLAGWFVK